MKAAQLHGLFVISLDFELHWGVSETKTVANYKENLDNTRQGIRLMLELFKQYDIHVTWATVGFLFCKNKNELVSRSNALNKPNYKNSRLSNYHLFPEIGDNFLDDPYHFGADMITLIRSYPHQEIGTHTFSHYYCLEEGVSDQSFSNDLDAAIDVAKANGITIDSIVFPRNQYSKEHLDICYNKGIKVYRGSSDHWLYRSLSSKEQHAVRRLGRLADSYFNLSGYNTYKIKNQESVLINVPGSRFLRPYSPKLDFLEKTRFSRIKKEMTFAAKNKRMYHLWWHPHNFGKYQKKNISFLKNILDHYQYLKENYFFASFNMAEAATYFKSVI